MEFIVRVWAEGQPTRYYEFASLDEAKSMSDYFAESLKRRECDYDVMIYEATKY